MIANTFKTDVSDALEFVEDGIKAAHAFAVCEPDITGQVLKEEEYQNAMEWIFDHLETDFHLVRMNISKELERRMDA